MTATHSGASEASTAHRQMPSAEHASLAFAMAGIASFGDAAPALRLRLEGEAFSSQGTRLGCVVDIAGNVKIRFDLPEAVEYHFLEFTLPIVPGRYRIERLVLRGTMVADLSRRVLQVRDRLLPEDASHQLRYASDFGRPSFEFDARGLDSSPVLADGPACIEVEIGREDAVTSFEAMLVDRVDSLSSALRQLSRELNEVASGHGQQLRRQEERLAAVHRTLAARADEHASAQLRLGEQIRQLHEQFVSMNASHSKGITAALQIMQQTHEQVGQVRFAIENVFWRRWLRYLRRVWR